MPAPAPLLEHVWQWMKYGTPGSSARRSAAYVSEADTRWWERPAAAWRTLARRRPIVATPLLYIAAMATGLVVGLGLQWIAGIPWWIAPLCALALAWLWVATSIWWHPAGRSKRLRTELLLAFAPARGVRADSSDQRRRILASGLPLLVPVGFAGSAQAMSWGGSQGRIDYVTLSFSGSDSVETPADPDSALTIDSLARGSISEEELRARIEREHELSVHGSTWHPAILRVDGREHAGSEFRGTSIRAAYCAIDDAWIAVASPRSTLPALETATDPHTTITLF